MGLTAFVAAPLYRAPAGPPTPDRTDLQARREALRGALRELEWDRGSGLLDPREHRRQREEYEVELAAVLRELARSGGEHPTD